MREEAAERRGYGREDVREVVRRQEREGRRVRGMGLVAEEFAGARRGAAPPAVVAQGERTPEREEGDLTPVYGSLEESSEEEPWGSLGEDARQEVVDRNRKEVEVKSNIEDGVRVRAEESDGIKSDELGQKEGCGKITSRTSTEPVVSLPDQGEAAVVALDAALDTLDANLDTGYEAPPSPDALGLVEELQEEEQLDWEDTDIKEMVEKCRRVRGVMEEVGEEGEVRELGEDDETEEEEEVSNMAVVVLDTAVLLSSLPLVKELVQERRCLAVVPWQVTAAPLSLQVEQELASHGGGELALRARATLRWLSGHQVIVLELKL